MIQPIVEGKGDVEAVWKLLPRLIKELGVTEHVTVGKPMRQPRMKMVKESEFKKFINQLRSKNIAAILVLFDIDKDCARNLMPEMYRWAADEVSDIPHAIVMARCEYEAWILASVESLQGKHRIRPDASFSGNPEAKRGAKESLSHLMAGSTGYKETIDQAKMTSDLEFERVYRRSSSFRKLVKELVRLLEAMGHRPQIPDVWNPFPSEG